WSESKASSNKREGAIRRPCALCVRSPGQKRPTRLKAFCSKAFENHRETIGRTGWVEKADKAAGSLSRLKLMKPARLRITNRRIRSEFIGRVLQHDDTFRPPSPSFL